MKRSYPLPWILGLLTILVLASMAIPQQPSPAAKIDIPLQDPIEVQTRGLLHEAFAQPFDVKPEPGPMIPKEPPPPIAEEPPEQRPEAENTQWIPGYWGWDPQQQEFLWVSGVYRVPPQGRTFMPGYWQNTPDGWRWIHGFWSDANQQELPYTPEPPETLDVGPSMPAPDDNSVYTPGVWVYRDTRFVWRPGYYAPARVGRVWHPPYYVWTPNGYLFVDGYWDYPLEDRGLIFASVRFRQPLWRDAGWRYRPNFVVGFDSFFDSAFVGAGGFYYGDYYDPFYARTGYRPWYAGRGRYDPVFSYYGWRNQRNNPNWIAGAQTTFANRSAGRVAVPPRTLAQQTTLVIANKATPVVTPLNQFKSTQVKLVQTTPTQLETQRIALQRTREIAVNRQQLDAANVTKATAAKTFSASTGKTLKLPTVLESRPAGPATRIETPRTFTPTPKTFTPPPAPRVVTPPPPPPRVTSPPAPKKAAIHVDPPRTISPSPAVVRTVTTPPTPVRVQSAPLPHVQSAPPPRVQSAPARSNPPPARVNPPPRPTNSNRKR